MKKVTAANCIHIGTDRLRGFGELKTERGKFLFD
jgi:hypothetical protein